MSDFRICPICENEREEVILEHHDRQRDILSFKCKICGDFTLTHISFTEMRFAPKEDRLKISVFTRERTAHNLDPLLICWTVHPQAEIPSIGIQEIIQRFPKTISERVDRALINLSKLSKNTGDILKIEPFEDYALIFADSNKIGSFFFIRDILLSEDVIVAHNMGHEYSLTARGWSRIYELETVHNPLTKQVFIAMSFHSSLDEVWQNGLARAIRDAGFEPHRVSESETNGKICDEIIVQIRKSKFVVADFTYQRNGVYFEAGYALGIGIPVIWTCKREEIDAGLLHFDTRQYNHIAWENEEDLYKRLYNRIKANIL